MQEDLLQPPAFQVTLRCKEHKQGLIVKGCVDSNCRRKKILLCQQCLSEDAHMEHNNNVLGIKQFIAQFSQSINQATQQNKSQLESFLNNDNNLKVYKYIQDNKYHLKKVRDNIDSQKTLIAFDITQVVEQFQLNLQQVKDSVFKKLDSFYLEYEQLLESTRKQFNSKFFPAANYFLSTPMALTCKLGQQGDNSEEYLKKLKQIDNSGFEQLQEQFNKLLIANESPKIFEPDTQKLLSQLQEILQNYYFGQFSNEKQLPQLPLLINQYSNNSQQIYQSPQKNLSRENYGLSDSFLIQKSGIYSKFSRAIKYEWPHVKPIRKFTLDFTIGAVIALSKSTFVLLGSNDSKLRVFDPEKKQLLAFDGHYQQANFIEQLGVNTFITGADDGQIFYWLFQGSQTKIIEQFNFSSKPIMAGLDLQNNSFAFVDLDGRVGYKNIDNRLELFLSLQNPNRYMVKQRKQFKMSLIKAGELFYVYTPGEQGASIIQVNEKEKVLRRLNANTLPTGQAVFPLSMNEVLLATSTGLKICNMNNDEILGGGDVDIVLMEFTSNQTIFVIAIPIENGISTVYKIVKGNHNQYDIQQKELVLEGIQNLNSKLKPRVQLIKNQDKLQLIIVNQDKINFFDINIK